MRTDVLSRVRLAMGVGAIAYAFRAWNLYGNTRSTVLWSNPSWLWPASYAVSALILAGAVVEVGSRGPRRDRAVMWATSTVISLSVARGWAVVGSPSGGWDSLHVLANFVFLAVVVTCAWPFALRGEKLDAARAVLAGPGDDSEKLERVRAVLGDGE